MTAAPCRVKVQGCGPPRQAVNTEKPGTRRISLRGLCRRSPANGTAGEHNYPESYETRLAARGELEAVLGQAPPVVDADDLAGVVAALG
jgi:hypothetical protein